MGGNWTPRTKAVIVGAMHEWIADNPGDNPKKPRKAGDTVLKARAEKIFDLLDLGQKSPQGLSDLFRPFPAAFSAATRHEQGRLETVKLRRRNQF